MPTAPPLRNRIGRHACGFCGGNVYLEHDDSGALPVDPALLQSYQRRRAS